MADNKDTMEIVLEEISKALQSLEETVGDITSDPLKILYFIRELGWDIQVDTDQINSVKNGSFGIIGTVASLANQFSGSSTDLTALPGLISDFICQASQLPQELNTGQLPGFAAEFPRQLLDYVILKYLKDEHPKIFYPLVLLGICEVRYHRFSDPAPPFRINYMKYEIKWDRFGILFSDPYQLPQLAYNWGTPDFDSVRFIQTLFDCFRPYGIPAYLFKTDPELQNTVTSKLSITETSVSIPIIDHEKELEIGIKVYPIPSDIGTDNAGLAISPYLIGSNETKFEITDFLSLLLKSSITIDKTTGIIIRPHNNGEYQPKVDLFDIRSGNPPQGKIRADLTFKRPEKMILFGSPSATRMELGNLGIGFEADAAGTDFDISLEFQLNGASLVIAKGDGDGFIQKLLPSDPIQMDFELAVGFSKKRGIYFKGGAALEYSFQINQSLGPINIRTIDITLGVNSNGEIFLITAASADAELGPVTASVKKIGLKTTVELGKPGALGNADLSLGFKPPSGIGLKIDASVVVGGGYLEIEDGNYAGILYLEIQKIVTVTVIGILTTKIPGGSPKFSLKLIGMVEFPPIQLGMGFVLTGIGLAIAVESCMNAEALRNSVYSGSLSSLMFPPDPIKNAQKIIADLKSFFPPKAGAFVFGAMVKVGWGGATTLVTASVGIFIEIDNGSFSRIALAGIAVLALPTKDDSVLFVQMQLIGIVDFNDSTFSLDASLFGSKLLQFNLDGDIAIRSCWGEHSRFALAAGGFYPGYKPPAGFPTLKRLSITIGSDNPRIGLFTYFAAVENSIQFGAALLFHYQKKVTLLGLVEVDGQFGFDALFKFNPFYFEANMYACLDLKVDGDPKLTVNVKLFLSGPNNYHAKGYAKFKVLGFKVSVDFDKTFGNKQIELPKPVISPWAALENELQTPKNWSIISPHQGYNVVVFREGIEELYLDNAGNLQFRQRAIPLKFRLQKFGEAAIPDGENYFDLNWITPGNSEEVQDGFAPAQFEYLSDQEKISAPPFEKMKSGIIFSGGGSQVSTKRYGKPVSYETKVITTPDIPPTEVATQSVMDPALLHDWQQVAGEQYHHRYGEESANASRIKIKVKEQQFTLVTAEAENGKFRRVGDQEPKTTTGDYPFARARQIQKEMGTEGTEIMNTAKANPV